MLLDKHKLTMEEVRLPRFPLMVVPPLGHSLRISVAGNSLPPGSLRKANSLSSSNKHNKHNKQAPHITARNRGSLST
jgi:hypothetical protein